jgi:hypothetical protein
MKDKFTRITIAVLFVAYAIALSTCFAVVTDKWSKEFSQQPEASRPPAACVRVIVDDEGPGRSYGSGGFIGPQLIVTANHVVKDREGDEVEILFPSWEVVRGKVIKTDSEIDLCLIELYSDPKTAEPFSLCPRLVDGMELAINGYGYGTYKQQWGTLSSTRYTPWRCVNGAMARSGDSGGPLVDADDGLPGLCGVQLTTQLTSRRVDVIEDFVLGVE